MSMILAIDKFLTTLFSVPLGDDGNPSPSGEAKIGEM
jgi:hypothetical protein